MPRMVLLKCTLCEKDFEIEAKKAKKTCSKECAYKLRKESRQTEHNFTLRLCESCEEEFYDTSKTQLVKRCRSCVLKQGVETRKSKGSYKRTAEQNEAHSVLLKEKYASGELAVTDEHRKMISDAVKRSWETGDHQEKVKRTCQEKYGKDHWMKTDEARSLFSEIFTGREITDEHRHNMSLSQQKRLKDHNHPSYTSGKGGKREDLGGQYFRSMWEANFARVMNYEGKIWEYETKTFQLTSALSYTPDFLIDGVYYEIKGIESPSYIEKFALFKEIHPEIEIVVIDGTKYLEMTKKYKKLIKEWEGR